MAVILETDRLILRQFTLADAPFIVDLLNSRGWLQYIGDRNIKTIAEAQSYLRDGPIMAYSTYGFGLYGVALKDGGTLIGMCGLLKRDYLDHMDVGYALLPDFQNQGYAYEIANATMNYAFDNLHLLHLAAITNINNQRSIQLLEKLGFVFKEMINLGKEDLMLFVRDSEGLD